MGFISPRLPDFDLDEWRARPHHRRIEPLAQDWVRHGFGPPAAIFVVHLVKLVVFAGGAVLVLGATPGLDGDFSSWWSDPIAYQKFVVWALLWEILGLGCGSMPLPFRFRPRIGGFLYWTRLGTVRLAPWPTRIPFTAGTRREPADVALYLTVLASAVGLLFTGSTRGVPYDTLPPANIWVLLGALVVLGLRDKTPFLAARPEHYAVMLLIFTFPPTNMVFALKLVMVGMWWGAATSKLNRHFPLVVPVMISSTPWLRSTRLKRKLWRHYPDDLRPSSLSTWAAYAGTAVEFVGPLVLLLSRGGTITLIALTIMVLFHVHIASTFPLGVPLEWNVFVIYSTVFLFGHHASVGVGSLDSVVLSVLLALILIGLPVLGNVAPRLVSVLPSMRDYAGNWATSVWLFRNDGSEEHFDGSVTKCAPIVVKQLRRLYDDDLAELLLYRGLAFRSLHSHGRALNGLMTRAVDDLADYTPREGELVAGVALGWNFGDGHLHGRQLLAAIQEQADFGPGQLRVITLESQPIQRAEQRYRILDAADGLLEEGVVRVADMLARPPWLAADDVTIPVRVTGPGPVPAATRPAAPTLGTVLATPSVQPRRPVPRPSPQRAIVNASATGPAMPRRPRPSPRPRLTEPA